MQYLRWSLLALAAYTLVPPFVSYAGRQIPSEIVALVTNSMLVVATVGVVVYSETPVVPYASHPRMPYLLGAGVCLSVGILAYYRALALGPVSRVTPVFGMFIVTSSVVGIAVLDESLTARKVAGIALAVLAVYLTTGE